MMANIMCGFHTLNFGVIQEVGSLPYSKWWRGIISTAVSGKSNTQQHSIFHEGGRHVINFTVIII